MSKRYNILKTVGDTWGHQIVKVRSQERKIPEWANNDSKIREFIVRAFPKLHTNFYQQEHASRWVRVAHLYFKMGYTYTQVAKEMNLTTGQVLGILRNLRRASKGLWANGAGKHGVRRVGRPVKNGTPRL